MTDNNTFSPFTLSSAFPTLSIPTPLETLSITSLSTLESLIETSGELFNSLLEYSQSSKEGGGGNNEDEKRQKVIQCYEKYKKLEQDLKGYIDGIVKLQEKKKNEGKDEAKAESSATSSLMQTSSSNTAIIDKLIENRETLLTESETQKTQLTHLLEQTYKLQFQIQTLLACSEQQNIILPSQSDQQQPQQQQQ